MGILYGIGGMIALIAAYWADAAYTYNDGTWLIAVAMSPGAIVGLVTAYAVGMTSLPEMVGAYNGFGGLAAALEAMGLYLDPNNTNLVRNGEVVAELTDSQLIVQAIALVLSVVIGMTTFTGSMVAVGKLHGTIASKPRVVPCRSVVTVIMMALMVVFGVLPFTGDQYWNDRGAGLTFLCLLAVVAGAYGLIAVMAIGGGDMPVSISFLNSLSGFSTSAAGFMLSNKALVVSGAFVGCSGIILTLVMCHAMNRSVANVLIGGWGDDGVTTGVTTTHPAAGEPQTEGKVQTVTAEEVVDMLTDAKSVIVVPGYGMVRILVCCSLEAESHCGFNNFLLFHTAFAGCRQSSAFDCRVDEASSSSRNPGSFCDSSGGRANARSHECPIGRGKRPL